MSVKELQEVNQAIIQCATLKVLQTTQSTGTLTGSLQCLGGTSISKNLYVGGTTNILGDVTIPSITSVTKITNTTSPQLYVQYDATNNLTFNVNSSGQATLSASGGQVNFASGNIVQSLDTTDTSLTNSGALMCRGGVGISKNVVVGGSVIAPSAMITSASAPSTGDGTLYYDTSTHQLMINISGTFKVVPYTP